MRRRSGPKGIARLIREHDTAVVCGHVRPDADCVGSQLALARAMGRAGKRAAVWLPDALPPPCAFLAGSGDIVCADPGAPAAGLVITLDTPRPERMGWIAGRIMGAAPLVNIDHHLSNIGWGTHNWVDQRASATAEMILRLLREMGAGVDREMATCLYAGILTDTGRFCYANTTPRTHRAAAALLRAGVDPEDVGDRLYGRNRKEKTALLGLVLETLRIGAGGALASLRITREMYARSKALPQDSEGLINYARDIAGVKVAVVLEEPADGGGLRVSMRSRDGRIDVNEIAARYGGGGHRSAAGALIPGDPERIERRLMEDIGNAIERAGGA